MIKISVKYKENCVGELCIFERVIKYKHPKRIFKIKIKQTVASTIDMSLPEYVDKVCEVLFKKEREKMIVSELVRKDIEEREIAKRPREQIIKESAFTMEIKS